MIRLRLLGAVDLTGDDGRPLDAALRRSKVIAVLAYLAAARPRGFHRRDKVAALFWPELPGERARAALRVTLTRLRDALGADVVISRGADELAIDRARLWCDVTALDDAIASGDATGAATFYSGAFLDGVHIEGTAEELEHWIEAERARIQHDLVRALSASDRVDDVRRAIEIAPLDERPVRRLIETCIAAKDHSAALRTFEEFSRRLEREFGVAPSESTASLVAGLRGERTLSPAAGQMRIDIAPAAPRSESALTPRPHRLRYALGTVTVGALVWAGSVAVSRARGTTTTHETASRQWSTIGVASAAPIGRLAPEAFVDSTDEAVVVIGGVVYGEGPADSHLMNDVHRLAGLRAGELAEWRSLSVKGAAPEPRWMFGLAYDAGHDRAIVHGGARGFTSPCSNDTWILSHASGTGASPEWTKVQIDGLLPPPRAGMRIAYDAANRRMMFVGGHDCGHDFHADAWVLAFGDSTLSRGRWTKLTPDTAEGAPFGRSAYAAAYDARTNRLLMEGGYVAGRVPAELWVLEHANGIGSAAWRRVKCAGTPPPLRNQASAYDSTRGTWILFGGTDSTQTVHHDVWRASGLGGTPMRCAWTRVSVDEPLPSVREDPTAMLRRRTRELVVYGGSYHGSAFRDVITLRDPFDDSPSRTSGKPR